MENLSLDWKTWGLNQENCYAVFKSDRHKFICSDKSENDFREWFTHSETGYKYDEQEIVAHWNVILAARAWFRAMFLVETGVKKSLNAAYEAICRE